MTETMLRTALGETILKHWREHCPQMVRDLEKQNRLDQAVFEAQETTGDLLYELVSVKKMNYQAAWELAAQEWALPESGARTRRRPGTSRRRTPPEPRPGRIQRRRPRAGGARRSAARLPDNRGPPDRAGRAEGKGPRQYRSHPHAAGWSKTKAARRRDAEKAVLARYSGWGALANVFHPYPRSDWEEIARDVQEHLTPEEYDSARASTPNAHFTSPMVIEALWQAMERFGLDAGRANP